MNVGTTHLGTSPNARKSLTLRNPLKTHSAGCAGCAQVHAPWYKTSTVLLVLFLAVAMAHGSTIFQAGDKHGCPVLAGEVQKQIEATQAEYPADWRIVIACTDAQWDDILRHFDWVGVSNYAITWRDAHRVTVIRGQAFHGLTDAQQKHVVLHELGHIVLQTADEDKADGYARQRGF